MWPIINALLDPVVNFGKVTVSVGYDNIDNVVVLNTGDGSKLPNPASGSFNLVWFDSSTYYDPADDPKVEIVRCTARDGDTLTIARPQEGTLASTKNTPDKIYKMILSPTKKTIDDIQTESQSNVSTHSALNTGVHGVGIDTIDGVSARNIAIDTAIDNHANLQIDHVNLLNIGTNTHAQIDTKLTSLQMADIFKNIVPTTVGWTTSPLPLIEMTDENKVEFSTVGYCGTNVGGSLTWDVGAIYFVRTLRIDLKFSISSGVSAGKTFTISGSTDGTNWTTIQYWLAQNTGVGYDGQLHYYDIPIRYLRIDMGAGYGAVNSGSLSGRVIYAS